MNAVNDGLRTYATLKQIDNQRKQQQWQEEDRQLRLGDYQRAKAREEQLMAREDEQHDFEQDTRDFALINAHLSSGLDLPENLKGKLQNNRFLNINEVIRPEVVSATQVAKSIANGQVDINSHEGIQALNTLLPEVMDNSASAGNKRISKAFYDQAQDSFTFELDIDGRKAPVTVGRDENPNAEVMQIPAEKLINRAASLDQLQRFYQSDEGQRYFSTLSSQLGLTKDNRTEFQNDYEFAVKHGFRGSPADFKTLSSKKSGGSSSKDFDFEHTDDGLIFRRNKRTGQIEEMINHQGRLMPAHEAQQAQHKDNLSLASQSLENAQQIKKDYQAAGIAYPPELDSIIDGFAPPAEKTQSAPSAPRVDKRLGESGRDRVRLLKKVRAKISEIRAEIDKQNIPGNNSVDEIDPELIRQHRELKALKKELYKRNGNFQELLNKYEIE